MHPKPDELVGGFHLVAGHQQYSPDDPGEVPQVEHVVGLGGGGQEGFHGPGVNSHRRLHHRPACVGVRSFQLADLTRF